jgi:hypothetical protein
MYRGAAGGRRSTPGHRASDYLVCAGKKDGRLGSEKEVRQSRQRRSLFPLLIVLIFIIIYDHVLLCNARISQSPRTFANTNLRLNIANFIPR